MLRSSITERYSANAFRTTPPKACANIPAQQLDGLDKTLGDLEDEIVGAHAQSEKSSLRNEVPSIKNS
jgi:hypothetical protein